jgi:glycosyltransferase involved in cell wall biosynthesis
MPSGVVRVERYLPRFRAMGIECTVINYFSPALARNRWRWEGPRRHRWSVARAVARNLYKALDTLHILGARIRIIAASRSADAVVLQWIAPPVWLTRLLARGRARLVYDFDDAVHLVNPERVDEVIRRAWRVLAGSHALLEHARSLSSAAALVPSAVDVEQFTPGASDPVSPCDGAPVPGSAARPLRIGWLGSAGTLPYLAELEAPLARLAGSGTAVRLVVAGTGGRKDLVPAPAGVEVLEIDAYRGDEMPAIAAMMDVGVMPMPDGPWEQGKCAMKALIYMAAGLPVICSPVGENVHVVRDGTSGLHARTADEWFDALRLLASSPELRERLGRSGRERVETDYATAVCFELLRDHVLTPLVR